MNKKTSSQTKKNVIWFWSDSPFICPFDSEQSEEIEEDYQDWLLKNDKASQVFDFFVNQSSFCIDYKKMKTFCITSQCEICARKTVHGHMNYDLLREEYP